VQFGRVDHMQRLIVLIFLLAAAPLAAQERLKPKAAKGGTEFGEPWAQVPQFYKEIQLPQLPVWQVPTDLKAWQQDRLDVRKTLLKCLGDLPKRPDPRKVVSLIREEHDGYLVERFDFFNGVDQTVAGILLIPKDLK